MSKTTLTTDDVHHIRQGNHIRKTHHPIRHRLRRICAECGNRWRKHGCALYLWATDYLSQFSRILIPDRPERPRHRHTPTYTRTLQQATNHIRQTRHPRPHPWQLQPR